MSGKVIPFPAPTMPVPPLAEDDMPWGEGGHVRIVIRGMEMWVTLAEAKEIRDHIDDGIWLCETYWED